MAGWAIEAEDLVKRFTKRAPGGSLADANATRLAVDGASSSRPRRWPLKPRTSPDWFAAVDGVNLQIRSGEGLGLLGPNGAGKSTTIRMLCILLEPTSGSARVNRFDLIRQANQVRHSLGTVPASERGVDWESTARENLEYFAALYHLPPHIACRHVDELLKQLELSTRADDLVETFSTGMKQHLALARALLAWPPILLPDEPTLGQY